MMITHRDVRGPHREACDYVVVGSGPAGATAARVLAEGGAEVVIIEEGAPWPLEKRGSALYPTMKGAWRDLGTNTAFGGAMIPILQGCAVGGTSVINSAISWRLPEDVHAQWSRDEGIADRLPYAEFDRVFTQLEHELNIRPVAPAVRGELNNRMELGCERLGVTGHRIERNEEGCVGSGRCLQGCPSGAKLSMDRSFVPRAMRDGARVLATCRVDKIRVEGGRAVGVGAHFRDPLRRRGGVPCEVEARRGVVVAASAIQSPILLKRSRIGNRSGQVGRNFQAHPGAGVVGLYDDDIEMWTGATQGYETVHFRDQGFKLETLALPPELAAARLPGVGKELMARLGDYRRMGLIAAQVRAAAQGRVGALPGGRPLIRYDLTPRDLKNLVRAMGVAAEIHFAAGAREVLLGIHGFAEVLRSPDELRVLAGFEPRANQFSMIATHLFGTCRMGSNPDHNVVGPNLESHDVSRLYVVDSSVFPTNLGVNPQCSIMALSWLAAEGMLRDHARASLAKAPGYAG